MTHQHERRTTVASAPGKVLIAGGYLVLDPAYPGLVISTDSRFYSYARSIHSYQPARAPAAEERFSITVRSPQFVDAVWHYKASLTGLVWNLQQTRASYDTAGRNPFVSLAILYTLRLASEILGAEVLRRFLSAVSPSGIELVVVGDNDFYSQRDTLSLSPTETPTMAALASLPPFAPQSCRIGDVHKTGLGSSAAMTTSLVGCLLTHLGAVARDDDGAQLSTHSLALVHNLAQLAHCAAQGKVGSGFDVSAAVWGSQLYRRFDPAVLKPCLEQGDRVSVEGDDKAQPQGANGTAIRLLETLDPSNPLWLPSPLSSSSAEGQTSSFPTAIEGLVASSLSSSSRGGAAAAAAVAAPLAMPAPLSLPPGFDMVLADVDAGSNTPSLVSKVLAWRAAKPEWASQLYAVLASSNASLADHFLDLAMMHDADPDVYNQVIRQCAAKLAKDWDAILRSLPAPAPAPATASGTPAENGEDEEEAEEVEVTPHRVLSVLIEVRNTLKAIRAGMRELGTRAGAPVEPREMGDLIHHVALDVPGIVGGGVPGAGGYDALFLLYLRPAEYDAGGTREKVEKFWKMHRQQSTEKQEGEKVELVELNVGPLLSRAAEGRAGLRVEDVGKVKGLEEVVERTLGRD
ncbi:phosphomevalonate kinase [Thecaphora frezii]